MIRASPFLLSNSRRPIVTPTYDGSGQVVHPDVLVFLNKFRGKTYVLCVDPFPGGDNQKENPSIIVSERKASGFVETLEEERIPNPISGTPEPGWFNSDSDIIYWKDKFWLYWRAGHLSDYYRELILRMSEDLVNWNSKRIVYSYNSKGAHRYCSPAFIPERKFLSVLMCDATDRSLHLFETKDGENLTYKQRCNFTLPSGRSLWHIDVVKLSNGEYWALACERRGSLWFAKSRDRINWLVHYPPVLQPKEGSWDCARIHRTTFAVYNSRIMVWYCAHNESGTWHCGYTESDVEGLNRELRSGNVFGGGAL